MFSSILSPRPSILCLIAMLKIGHCYSKTPGKPNFVFIMTDDQDLHLSSLDYMPLVQKQLGSKGTFYSRHYCTVSLCCPSRVSLLTGKAAHNTNVTNVTPPYGGYPKFISQGLNEKYLPVWLQAAGYDTYYTGKLMNAYTTDNWNSTLPAGWNGTDFLVDPYMYNYWNPVFQKNSLPPVSFPNQYNTDLVNERALGFLDTVVNSSRPFFIGIAPTGPHAAVSTTGVFTKPIPATRHEGLFPGAKVPRTKNFNPKKSSGVSWISKLERLNETTIAINDDWYRARLQALQAVDDLVDNVITRLEHNNLIDNTYIIYTSDNGYHISQHRLGPGKTCGIEEDINVPFYIRGPGVAEGKSVDIVSTHTDIVPTLFQLAGIEQRHDFDGAPFPVTIEAISKVDRQKNQDHVNVEYWGTGLDELTQESPPNTTYKTLRIIRDKYNLMYSVWCSNEHELYNMIDDPGQLNNLALPTAKNNTLLFGKSISALQNRLDALLLVLKTCKARSCTDPWSVLHPQGDVTNLQDALETKYDEFYAQQPKVSFSKCELGQILSSEGPLVANAFQGNASLGLDVRF